MYPVRWDCIFSSSKSQACPATTIDVLMPQNFRYLTKREAIPAGKVQSFFDNEEVASLTAFESTFPFISRVMTGKPSETRDMLNFLRSEQADLKEMVILGLVGYLLNFKLQSIFRRKVLNVTEEEYRKTKYHHIINHISQGFMLAAFTTLVESCSELAFGYSTEKTAIVTNSITTLLFSIWGSFRLKYLKDVFMKAFLKFIPFVQSDLRMQRLCNRISDGIFVVLMCLFTLDNLGFRFITFLKSLSVVGSITTLALTFGSQDLTSNLLSGFSIQTSNPFDVGDEIQLENGELGYVESIGPLFTYVRGHDELVTKISNTDLDKMRLSNLALVTTSQVKQELRFDFGVVNKTECLVDEIKQEIKKVSKLLITDKSRPFRVHFTGFGEQWVEVTVDCRLKAMPFTDEYYDERQKIMQAIAKAAKNCNARFAEDL